MIHYVVATGPPGAVRDVVPGLRQALLDTTYMRGTLREAVDPEGCWALAAIDCPDPLASERLVVRGRTFLVVNGPALAVHGRQAEVASTALDSFEAGGLPAAVGGLRGAYNLVAGSPGHGVRAAVDPAGSVPQYRAAGELTVISNRASTAAAVLGRQGWDPVASSWLIALGIVVDAPSPVAGVVRLLPHQHLHVPLGANAASTEPAPSVPWPGPDAAGRDRLTSEEWDQVTDDLIAGCRSLATTGVKLNLLLSGGLDSRLCLALAKAAGLQDHLQVVTRGMPDHPEMASAVEAAEVAGFEHRARPPLLPPPPADGGSAPPPFDAAGTWQRIRQAVHRFEGTVCPWDGLMPPSPIRGTIVEIKGFLGPLFKGPGSIEARYRRSLPSTLDEAAAGLIDFMQPHDPLGLLRPEAVSAHRQRIGSWVAEAATDTRLDLLPTRFYVEQRLGTWIGPIQQFAPGRITVNLLSSSVALARAWELGPAAANGYRFHYEVMRRAAPELVEVPFFKFRWPDEIESEGRFDLSRPPYPAPKLELSRAIRSWQWELLATEGPAIVDLFERARSTSMAQVVDVDRAVEVARGAGGLTKVVEAKAVLSCVAVALSALGETDPVCDEPTEPAA